MINLLKSWKFWLISAISVAVVASLIVFVFNIVNANAKLDAPTNLEVIELSNGTKYIQVDANSNALTYEYVIIVDNVESTITDPNNAVDVSALLAKPDYYQIKCRIIGQTANSTSDFCDIIGHSVMHKIKTVSVWLGENENSTKLYFSINDNFLEEVSLSFEMFYSANGDNTFQKITTTPTTDSLNGVASGFFDLSSLPNAEYSISVRATCENANYIESSLSEQIIYIAV